MNRATLLRLHRWVSLTFMLPLAAVIATGLVLSLEPVAHQAAIQPGTLSAQRVGDLLARHDPGGQARALTLRPYDGLLVIGGARPGPPLAVSLDTGEEVRGGSSWSDVFLAARRLHETLLLDLGWLVIASTFAMLALAALGVLMGLPRLRNTLAGWHKAVAWGLLPLLVASPLTGLFIAYGITFAPAPAAASPAAPLRDAARIVQASGHDLSGLVWLRSQGGRTLARLSEGGEWRLYAVTPDGVVPQARNWPRLLHEGNFAATWTGLLNAVISLALAGLLATGLVLWARRTPLLRRRRGSGGRASLRPGSTAAPDAGPVAGRDPVPRHGGGRRPA